MSGKFNPCKITELVCVAVFCLFSVGSHAQSMMQVPIASTVFGIPATTYNGTTPNGSICAEALNAYGDGCVPTQATLTYPYMAVLDSQNNIYVDDFTEQEIRTIYNGGSTLAAVIVAGLPGYNLTAPTPGRVYSFGATAAITSNSSGVFYCNGSSGAIALDSGGDGCPAQYGYIKPRGVGVDSYGNIFIATQAPTVGIRIIYAGGAAAANLITEYNPTVTAPQIGYIYSLSKGTDFITPRGIAIDSNENVYVADNGAQITETGLQATTSGNQIKEFTGTGWTTYISYNASDTPATNDGDGGPASAAYVSAPDTIVFDQYNNLYIGDITNRRVRVVYNAGVTAPLYVQGANSTVITNPVSGDIYTVAGNPSITSGVSVSGTLGSQLYPANLKNFGVDAAGNIWANFNGVVYRVNVSTGVATIIMDYAVSQTYGSLSTAPAAGVACNGSSGGPLMTDAYADGCPTTEIAPLHAIGRFVFDTAGNAYAIQQMPTSSGGYPVSVLRGFQFASQFGSVAAGTPSTQVVAFTPTTPTTYTPILSLTGMGNSTNEFTDAGGHFCFGTSAGQTCTYNVKFTPALAGSRLGGLTLSGSSGNTLATTPLGGIGTGAQIAIDPGMQSTVGSGFAPTGVAVDQSGNFYLSDAITNNVFKSTLGGTPVQFATGFSQPTQIAVSGLGTVYVADTGDNRIAAVTQAGVVSSFLVTYNSVALSKPSGVAVDLAGNVFVADTGNNRILEVSASLGTTFGLKFTGLSSPLGIAVDASDDVFVADSGNGRIVELSAAGVQSVIEVSPSLIDPVGVAVDPAGDLFIADAGNQNVVLFPAAASSATALIGNVTSLAGIAVDNTGDVYIAGIGVISGSTTSGLTRLNRAANSFSYPNTNVGQTYDQTLTLSSSGNTALTTGASLSSGTNTADFTVTSATTNGCSVNATLSPGQNCELSAVFQPQSSAALTDTLTFPTSNAVNPAAVLLTGNGVNETATTTTLSYTTIPGGLPLVGQAFTVTATIASAMNVGIAGGSVTFTVDGNVQAPVNVASSAASISLTLAAGPHTITAVYSGDSTQYAGSNATNLSVTVVIPQASTLGLAYTLGSPGSVANTINTVMTATLSIANPIATITGTVTFTIDGGTPIPATVSSAGVASITLPLTAGSHTVVANYNGTSYYYASANTVTFPVVTGTSSLALVVTSPAGAITYGQPVVISVVTTTGNSTAPAAGNVTFTVDGVTQPTVAFASSFAETLNLAAGTHMVVASYSGDTNYAPASASLSVVIAQAAPLLTFALTPNTSASGSTLTLTATLPATSTYPTGTIIFSSGSTSIGSANITNGTASFTTTTNVFNNYTFTASYSGDPNFLPESATIAPSPTFLVSSTGATSVAVPQNGTVVVPLILSSFYNYMGTIQLSCTGLPANTVCNGIPYQTSLAANSTQAVQLQFVTNAAPTTAVGAVLELTHHPDTALAVTNAALFLFLLTPWSKRRRRIGSLALVISLFISTMGLSGCASNTSYNSNNYISPTGTYTVNVVGSDGTVANTLTLTLIVEPAETGIRD